MNYQKVLDQTIESLEGRPSLLLHSCCAPCSSYVLEYLSNYFSITVFYYNPNIFPEEEYRHRVEEQQRLISLLPAKNPISFRTIGYDSDRFYEAVKGLEQEPEGGRRCQVCFHLRLSQAAKLAKEEGFDYFTTTLSISPMKNAETLNRIGGQLAEEYGVKYLYSDFKKKNGYLRSCQLSKEYGMYRQDYCGCIFSYRERQEMLKQKAAEASQE